MPESLAKKRRRKRTRRQRREARERYRRQRVRSFSRLVWQGERPTFAIARYAPRKALECWRLGMQWGQQEKARMVEA